MKRLTTTRAREPGLVSGCGEIWGFIDQAIGDREWILGERFCAADIHLFMLTTWLSPDRGHPTMEEFPHAARVAAKTAERAAVKKVYGL